MSIRFLRHATFVLEVGEARVLVDPMLSRAGDLDPIPQSPNQRRNPLVGLPLDDDELDRVLGSVGAVLVTHTHPDHWDERAIGLIPGDTPILCQPEDEDVIREAGFSAVVPIEDELRWEGTRFVRTGGRHGTGEIGEQMAPVSGFVVQSDAAPSVYVAGDTIWCPEVEEALNDHAPDVIVVNAGSAQFLTGDPITMTVEDVARVCRAAPEAQVVAVHMEAINHCLLTRAELDEKLREEGLDDGVEIPADGALVELREKP